MTAPWPLRRGGCLLGLLALGVILLGSLLPLPHGLLTLHRLATAPPTTKAGPFGHMALPFRGARPAMPTPPAQRSDRLDASLRTSALHASAARPDLAVGAHPARHPLVAGFAWFVALALSARQLLSLHQFRVEPQPRCLSTVALNDSATTEAVPSAIPVSKPLPEAMAAGLQAEDLGEAYVCFRAAVVGQYEVPVALLEALLARLAGGDQWLPLTLQRPARAAAPSALGPVVPGDPQALRYANRVFRHLWETGHCTPRVVALVARARACAGDGAGAETALRATGHWATATCLPALAAAAAQGDGAAALRVAEEAAERAVPLTAAGHSLVLTAAQRSDITLAELLDLLGWMHRELLGPLPAPTMRLLQSLVNRHPGYLAHMVAVHPTGEFLADQRPYRLLRRFYDRLALRKLVARAVRQDLLPSFDAYILRRPGLWDVIVDGEVMLQYAASTGLSLMAALQVVIDAVRCAGLKHPLVVLAEEPYWRLREEAPDWVRELRTLSVVCTCPAPAAHVLHAAALFNLPFVLHSDDTECVQPLRQHDPFVFWEATHRATYTINGSDLHITPAVEYAVCVQPFPEGFMVPLTSQHWLQVLRSQCNAADANASPDPLPHPHPHHPDLVSMWGEL